MKITFHGAARTVTGSRHLLQVNGATLLLDCGLFQGRRQETYERNLNMGFNPAKIDAVVLSHAHIDHSGNLPSLVKGGFRGPIYTTSASAHLSSIMLMDSGHIQELDAATVNKKHMAQGEAPVKPLYTLEDAAHVAQYFQSMDYGQQFEPIPGVVAHLSDAGHILGSASVVLEIEERGRKISLWFSGDIGRRNLPLLRDPVLPEQADYMIMECTYGDKPHREPEAAYDELRDVVRRTVQRGGKVIIPAFAVGRTQELAYNFHKMIDAGELPRIPIYVDSPLAINASEVFRQHPECFDEEMKEFREAFQTKKQGEMEEELGDMLFMLVNISRFIGVNPEDALRKTIRKFISRFRYIETNAAKQGKKLSDMTLSEMDSLWNEAKGMGK